MEDGEEGRKYKVALENSSGRDAFKPSKSSRIFINMKKRLCCCAPDVRKTEQNTKQWERRRITKNVVG